MAFKLPSLGLCEHEQAQSFVTHVTPPHGFQKGLKCMMMRFPKYINIKKKASPSCSLSFSLLLTIDIAKSNIIAK